MNEKNTQLSLIPMLASSPAIGKAFIVEEKRNDKGEVIGQVFKVKKDALIAEEQKLKGKENRDKRVEVRLAAGDELKGHLAVLAQRLSQDPRFTGANAVLRERKDGGLNVALRFKSVNRSEVVSFEKIAKAYGIPVEQVAAFIEAQKAKVQQPIDVKQIEAPKSVPATPAAPPVKK